MPPRRARTGKGPSPVDTKLNNAAPSKAASGDAKKPPPPPPTHAEVLTQQIKEQEKLVHAAQTRLDILREALDELYAEDDDWSLT